MYADIFISYSFKDEKIANKICNFLESNNLKCWIAPRDIKPGNDWAESICSAVKKCAVMVVIFSKNSNSSLHVPKELNLALNNNLSVIPFRIDDTTPTGSLEYYLSATHWINAVNCDLTTKIYILKDTIFRMLPDKNSLNILRPAGDL